MGLLGIIGGIFGVAGGVVDAFGAKKEAKAKTEAAKLNAALVRSRTSIEALLATREGIRGVGETVAAFGFAGVELGGSAGDVLRESRRDIAFQVASIKSIGEQEAVLFDKEAKAAKTAGKFAFASGLLGAAGSAFSII